MRRVAGSPRGTLIMAVVMFTLAAYFYVREKNMDTDVKITQQNPVRFAESYISSILGDSSKEDFEMFYSPEVVEDHQSIDSLIQQAKKENQSIFSNIRHIYSTHYSSESVFGNDQFNDFYLLRIYLENPVTLNDIYALENVEHKESQAAYIYLEYSNGRWYVLRQTLYPVYADTSPIAKVIEEQHPVSFAKRFLFSVAECTEYQHYLMFWHPSQRDTLSEELFQKNNKEAQYLHSKSTQLIAFQDNGQKAIVVHELRDPVRYHDISGNFESETVKRIEYTFIYEKGRWWVERYQLL